MTLDKTLGGDDQNRQKFPLPRHPQPRQVEERVDSRLCRLPAVDCGLSSLQRAVARKRLRLAGIIQQRKLQRGCRVVEDVQLDEIAAVGAQNGRCQRHRGGVDCKLDGLMEGLAAAGGHGELAAVNQPYTRCRLADRSQPVDRRRRRSLHRGLADGARGGLVLVSLGRMHDFSRFSRTPAVVQQGSLRQSTPCELFCPQDSRARVDRALISPPPHARGEMVRQGMAFHVYWKPELAFYHRGLH